MATKKLVSTNVLANHYNTSGDQILRRLRRAGIRPGRVTQINGRTYRDWDYELALAKLDEAKSDIDAKKNATPPAMAPIGDAVNAVEAMSAKLDRVLVELASLQQAVLTVLTQE